MTMKEVREEGRMTTWVMMTLMTLKKASRPQSTMMISETSIKAWNRLHHKLSKRRLYLLSKPVLSPPRPL